MSEKLIHEKTYKRKSLISFIHQFRLRKIRKVINKYLGNDKTSWADFGCSNGYIIEEISKSNHYNFTQIIGYDNNEKLLELARRKNIPNTEFKYYNMNELKVPPHNFDLVTCFESLEHVGSIQNAFANLFNHAKKGGIIIVSIPNETGVIGVVKLLGRSIFRSKPYGNFFKTESYWKYIRSLMMNDYIDSFRDPEKSHYGQHLGFDFRIFEKHLNKYFINNKKINLLEKFHPSLKMNIIYVMKKRVNQNYS